MKPFTPSKIKADVIFAASLAATFGFSIPDSVSVALIGGAAVITAGLNFGEALIERFDPNLAPKLFAPSASPAGIVPHAGKINLATDPVQQGKGSAWDSMGNVKRL
jgi:hypothetical protein